MKVAICEDCKRYWIMPVSQCSCGSHSLVEASLHNYVIAENREDYFVQNTVSTKVNKVQKIKDVSVFDTLIQAMISFTCFFVTVKISFHSFSWYAVVSVSIWLTMLYIGIFIISNRLNNIIKYVNEKEERGGK